ncbi:acetolactate synthase large subunit, partial [Staphylococcus pseudintermedius]
HFGSSFKKPDTDEIQKLYDYLKTSYRPVIVAGAGIHFSKSNSHLRHLVDQYQIPVVTTLHCSGSFPYDAPHFLGFFFMPGSSASSISLTECCLLINFSS